MGGNTPAVVPIVVHGVLTAPTIPSNTPSVNTGNKSGTGSIGSPSPAFTSSGAGARPSVPTPSIVPPDVYDPTQPVNSAHNRGVIALQTQENQAKQQATDAANQKVATQNAQQQQQQQATQTFIQMYNAALVSANKTSNPDAFMAQWAKTNFGINNLNKVLSGLPDDPDPAAQAKIQQQLQSELVSANKVSDTKQRQSQLDSWAKSFGYSNYNDLLSQNGLNSTGGKAFSVNVSENVNISDSVGATVAKPLTSTNPALEAAIDAARQAHPELYQNISSNYLEALVNEGILTPADIKADKASINTKISPDLNAILGIKTDTTGKVITIAGLPKLSDVDITSLQAIIPTLKNNIAARNATIKDLNVQLDNVKKTIPATITTNTYGGYGDVETQEINLAFGYGYPTTIPQPIDNPAYLDALNAIGRQISKAQSDIDNFNKQIADINSTSASLTKAMNTQKMVVSNVIDQQKQSGSKAANTMAEMVRTTGILAPSKPVTDFASSISDFFDATDKAAIAAYNATMKSLSMQTASAVLEGTASPVKVSENTLEKSDALRASLGLIPLENTVPIIETKSSKIGSASTMPLSFAAAYMVAPLAKSSDALANLSIPMNEMDKLQNNINENAKKGFTTEFVRITDDQGNLISEKEYPIQSALGGILADINAASVSGKAISVHFGSDQNPIKVVQPFSQSDENSILNYQRTLVQQLTDAKNSGAKSIILAYDGNEKGITIPLNDIAAARYQVLKNLPTTKGSDGRQYPVGYSLLVPSTFSTSYVTKQVGVQTKSSTKTSTDTSLLEPYQFIDKNGGIVTDLSVKSYYDEIMDKNNPFAYYGSRALAPISNPIVMGINWISDQIEKEPHAHMATVPLASDSLLSLFVASKDNGMLRPATASERDQQMKSMSDSFKADPLSFIGGAIVELPADFLTLEIGGQAIGAGSKGLAKGISLGQSVGKMDLSHIDASISPKSMAAKIISKGTPYEITKINDDKYQVSLGIAKEPSIEKGIGNLWLEKFPLLPKPSKVIVPKDESVNIPFIDLNMKSKEIMPIMSYTGMEKLPMPPNEIYVTADLDEKAIAKYNAEELAPEVFRIPDPSWETMYDLGWISRIGVGKQTGIGMKYSFKDVLANSDLFKEFTSGKKGGMLPLPKSITGYYASEGYGIESGRISGSVGGSLKGNLIEENVLPKGSKAMGATPVGERQFDFFAEKYANPNITGAEENIRPTKPSKPSKPSTTKPSPMDITDDKMAQQILKQQQKDISNAMKSSTSKTSQKTRNDIYSAMGAGMIASELDFLNISPAVAAKIKATLSSKNNQDLGRIVIPDLGIDIDLTSNLKTKPSEKVKPLVDITNITGQKSKTNTKQITDMIQIPIFLTTPITSEKQGEEYQQVYKQVTKQTTDLFPTDDFFNIPKKTPPPDIGMPPWGNWPFRLDKGSPSGRRKLKTRKVLWGVGDMPLQYFNFDYVIGDKAMRKVAKKYHININS